MNASNQTKFLFLTELVNRSECRKEDNVLLRDLLVSQSYETEKSATLTLLRTFTVEL